MRRIAVIARHAKTGAVFARAHAKMGGVLARTRAAYGSLASLFVSLYLPLLLLLLEGLLDGLARLLGDHRGIGSGVSRQLRRLLCTFERVRGIHADSKMLGSCRFASTVHHGPAEVKNQGAGTGIQARGHTELARVANG